MNDEEKLVLRVLTGPLYNVFNGNSTGHYALGERGYSNHISILQYFDLYSFAVSLILSYRLTLYLPLSHSPPLPPIFLSYSLFLRLNQLYHFCIFHWHALCLHILQIYCSPTSHTCACTCSRTYSCTCVRTDLKKVDTVRGGRVLAAMSVSEVKLCKALGINTSQRGDFLPFRNEKMGE